MISAPLFRRLAVIVVVGAVTASCTHCDCRAPAEMPMPASIDGDAPESVLARLSEDGEDAPALADALLAAAAPEIAFAGEIPVTFRRSDGSLPSYLVHPQGLAWIAATKRWAISAVEITRHRDPTEGASASASARAKDDRNGEGRAYLFFTDARGRLEPRSTLELPTRAGSFHPGGIDVFEGSIYLSLSPYVPGSRADLLRVPVAPGGSAMPIGELGDHIGLVTVNADRGTPLLRAASWDARRWYSIGGGGQVLWSEPSPLRIAFQDGRSLPGTEYLLWSGIVNPGADAFGIALLRTRGTIIDVARSIEWNASGHATPEGHTPLHNAAFFWMDRARRIWALTVPDDQHGRFQPRPHDVAAVAPGGDVEDPHAGRGSALRLYRISVAREPGTGG